MRFPADEAGIMIKLKEMQPHYEARSENTRSAMTIKIARKLVATKRNSGIFSLIFFNNV